AAARAAAWGDAAQAAALLRRALAEPPPAALRATLLTRLAEASVRLEGPSAAAAFEPALAASDDPREHVRIGIAKGRLLIEHSAPAAAAAAFDTARAALPDGADELRIALEIANAELLMAPAHAADAVGRLLAATTGLQPRDDRERELLAMRAYYELGVGAIERATAFVAPLIERPAIVLSLGEMAFESVVVTQVIAEDLDGAERWLTDGRALARAEGAGRAYRSCVLCLGFLANKRGELPAAERLLREALALHEELSWQRTFAICLLIDGLSQQGRWDEADALFDGWRRPETPYPIMLMPLAGHAASLVARGEAARGVALLEELFPLLSWQEILPVHRELALGLAAVGRVEEAVVQARARVARARGGPEGPAKLGAALRVLAAVDAEEDAVALLTEAVALLAPSHTRLEHARALCDLGAALRRAGRRADAREPLRQAHALASERGAEPIVRRAEEELAATGARVSRGPSADRDALTPSEARIARRAADGRTNREIATDLGVVPKTVEVHLTNVYRKLGIRSRDQLAKALADVPDALAAPPTSPPPGGAPPAA
ncbi:helix-turn-helix transcriptional regulator, partial [Conexibacter sp. CPCC 205706]